MKLLQWFLLLLLFINLTLISAARTTAGPQTYAVIVGVSRYNDPNIIALKYAHRDAEAFRNFLESPKGGSIPSENIMLLTNQQATRGGILRGLRDAFNKATEEDVVIFFFSGHGVPDPKITTDLYFTTYDTDDENYTGTALLKDDVARQFTASRAKLKLFFADACHSGGSGIYLGTKDDASELVNKLQANIAAVKEPSWAAVTASSSSEKSFENEKWGGGHGVFTYQLIQGLEGVADKTPKQNTRAKGNGDGIVTVRELYDYLSDVIPYETGNKQHPDKQGKNEDVFPVSAVSADKFATAVKKFKKVTTVTETPIPSTTSISETLPGKDEKKKFDADTKEMKTSICVTGSYAYGEYCFVNDYGEDIILTGAYGGGVSDRTLNMMVAVGERICVERLYVSTISNQTINTPAQTVTFYFKTVIEGKPIKFGTRKLTVEACKSKTEVLTRKNLYLSLDGEKW